MSGDDRRVAEARWLSLTREAMPAVSEARGWPVRADHCFQRILLDNACGGVWYDRIARRPAYVHAERALLDRAITLGEAVLAGTADLADLNARSLAWRRLRYESGVRAKSLKTDNGASRKVTKVTRYLR